ncbi:MAG: class I SAM-dependent methyltransferase [Bdellovibrionota bacterium]
MRSSASPVKSLLFTIIAQTIAFALSLKIRDLGVAPYIYLSCQALIAAVIAKMLKASGPWVTFNLVFPFGLMIFSGTTIPSWLIGSFVILIFLIYLPTFFTRVPYFATHTEVYQKVLAELAETKDLKLLDIGCGFGGLIFYLADKRPNQKFTGIELSPMCWLWTKLRSITCKNKNVEILYGNFWKLDFSNFEVIYAFLAPPPMPAVWSKIQTDRGVDKFISYCFEVPNVTPKKVLTICEERKLYIY